MILRLSLAAFALLTAACKNPSPPKDAAQDLPASPPPASASASAPASASAAPSTPTRAAACETDADCAAWSSYCGAFPCACMAFAKASGPPTCSEPNAVKCLVDPCRKKAAACQAGSCVITVQ